MRKLFLLLVCGSLFAEEPLPPVAMATVQTATVPLPVIRLAEVPLPEIKLPEIKNVFIISADWSDRSTPVNGNLALATVSVSQVELTSVANMTAAKEFRETKTRFFRDQRNLIYDSTAAPGNVDFAAWLDLFKNHTPYTAAYIPLQDRVRMVAELRHPVDEAVLSANLAFYKSKGYNAILVTFDGSEEPYHLAALADKVTAAGFKVWYAFGGEENLKLSVFIHPHKLQRLIAALAPKCAGMLLHWRRTSQHLLLQDRPFTDFLIRSAREVNPDLQIIGESYFGENAETKGKFAVATSLPANSSGVLLQNVGYSFYSPAKVFKKLFAHLKDVPKLVLVLGEKPYYATRRRNKLNFEQNWRIKKSIEDRFLAAGAAGTVTLHGDGSNGLYRTNHNDNIAQTGR